MHFRLKRKPRHQKQSFIMAFGKSSNLNILTTFIFFSIENLLLLQYSFVLVQNNSKDPFTLAVQKYKASGISAQVSKQPDALFVQYSAKNRNEKMKIVMDVILQHHLCRS